MKLLSMTFAWDLGHPPELCPNSENQQGTHGRRLGGKTLYLLFFSGDKGAMWSHGQRQYEKQTQLDLMGERKGQSGSMCNLI